MARLGWRSSAATFLVALLSAPVSAQVTLIDTVYTPPGYVDGSKIATIFVPDPSVSKGIGIILAHGLGAPRLGHRVWCDTLAARGYVAMTIDYDDTNTPGGLYPKPVRAFKTAVQFLRRNAQQFGISSGKIVAWGQSQGSVVWGQTIIWPNDYASFGTDPSVSDSVDAAILLYGQYDMLGPMPSWLNDILTTYFSVDSTLRSTRGNCIVNVQRIAAPVLLLHATLDPFVYVENSRMLHDSLTAHGVYNALVEFDASGYPDGVRRHAFDETDAGQFSSLGLVAKDTALAFLRQVFTIPYTAEETPISIPATVHLAQNFPNPFNPSTTIRYELPKSSLVRLSVYDLLGREVAVLVDEPKAPGNYDVNFDASKLTTGIYLYRITAGSFVQTRKLILLK